MAEKDLIRAVLRGGGVTPKPKSQRRVPIVQPAHVGRAMVVLSLLLAAGGFAVLYDQNEGSWLPGALGGAPSGIVTAGGTFAPLVVVSITLMIVMVEGGAMISEAYLKNREKVGLKKADAEWEKWIEAKEAAEREGRPFDEPPPSSRRQEIRSAQRRRFPTIPEAGRLGFLFAEARESGSAETLDDLSVQQDHAPLLEGVRAASGAGSAGRQAELRAALGES